jgi:hypothetical protein
LLSLSLPVFTLRLRLSAAERAVVDSKAAVLPVPRQDTNPDAGNPYLDKHTGKEYLSGMPAASRDIDTAVRELLAALHDYEVGRTAPDPSETRAAARRREAAIRNVAAHGLSLRTIAKMTSMSHTRVLQILEGQERRAETFAELDGLEGAVLADRLLALVYSNSMSREEMAQATGRSVEEINRLVSEHAEMLAQQRHEQAVAMVKRHMPPGWTP